MTEGPMTGDRDDYHATATLKDAVQEYLNVMSEMDAETTEYREQGSWRSVEPLSPDEREAAERLRRDYDLTEKQCYHNCQRVILHEGATGDDLAYVEGFTMSEAVPVPIKHAWLELDGTVLEVTFSDGPDPRENAVYYGVEYPTEAVIEQMGDAEAAYPMAGKQHGV